MVNKDDMHTFQPNDFPMLSGLLSDTDRLVVLLFVPHTSSHLASDAQLRISSTMKGWSDQIWLRRSRLDLEHYCEPRLPQQHLSWRRTSVRILDTQKLDDHPKSNASGLLYHCVL